MRLCAALKGHGPVHLVVYHERVAGPGSGCRKLRALWADHRRLPSTICGVHPKDRAGLGVREGQV